MLTLSTDERLALLLCVLGEEASNAAFKSMNPTKAIHVKQLLQEFKLDPPSEDEIEFVVQDFNNYFSFAMETLGPQIKEQAAALADAADNDVSSTPKAAASKRPKPMYFNSVESTGNASDDLNQLDPYQIATALEQDHPKTIAMVLRQLETPLAAAVLENLPNEVRTDSVVYLSQTSTVSEQIVNQVLISSFEKANSITSRVAKIDQSKVLAELMRALPKDMRNELIKRLTVEDPDLINEVRAKLYVFEDLLRLDDRDMQKVLGEIETDILIVALQKADPILKKKLLGNLSKRARQTIEEEMEYKSGVSMEEIDEARQSLVDVIGKLDESGDVTLS
ncbi:MAG: flagellar motor switch protein FliG [Mariniblastus sp.]|jgi:flagellar motor switch protein FliG